VIVRFGLVDGAADSWPDIFESITDSVRTSQLNPGADSPRPANRLIETAMLAWLRMDFHGGEIDETDRL
jgi:hypothetical protein